MTEPQQLKVGVRRGGGPPPGYEWSVGVVDFIFEEAIKTLRENGYMQLAQYVRELAMQPDPTHSATVDVRPIEDFFEIRDKGYPYGGANVRLFFTVDHQERIIVPLGVIKKQNDGPTPEPDKARMRLRLRRYRRGEFGVLPE